VQCKPGQDPGTCLSPSQAEAARRICAGARDAQGRRLVIGGPLPGSELAWAGVYVPARAGEPLFSTQIATDAIKYLYFNSPLPPSWSLRDLRFDAATLRSFRFRGLYDATDPDLSRFRARSRRLILYHGWADQHISPLYSIAYYQAVEHVFGVKATASFARLFLFPGMYHCTGGEGPYEFDVLTPLMAWVERHQPPRKIVATQPDEMRTRPVYPYPAVAVYDGRGNPSDASSFGPSSAGDEPKLPAWLGEKFFTSGDELSCRAQRKVLQCVRHARTG
jgi:Tannase and feruloyl esterase